MGLFRLTKYSAKHSSAGRFWGFNRIAGAADGKETLYMTRLWIGRLRLHVFHQGDQDPDCHDHPWGFWTFPLRSYVEEVIHPRRRTHYIPGMGTVSDLYYLRELNVVKAFRLHYRPPTYNHRVLGAYGGMEIYGQPFWHDTGHVPTLVWRERSTRKWGFTKERDGIWCWVPWKKYVYEGGKHGPCE